MRKILPFAFAALSTVFVAAYVTRDRQDRPVPAKELRAEPDYYHGRVVTVDTSVGWETGEGRTIYFPHKIGWPPAVVAHLPPGSPDTPKTVRGLFTRGDGDKPHTIHPVP